MNNVFVRSEALLPRTFQAVHYKAWIADLHNPKDIGIRAHHCFANVISGAAAEGISVEDIAYHNLASSLRPFLTLPDLLLCRILQKWQPWSRITTLDISEELIEKYNLLVNFADR